MRVFTKLSFLAFFLLGGMLYAQPTIVEHPVCAAQNPGPGAPTHNVPCGAIQVTPGECFYGCSDYATDITNGQGIGADCQSHGNNVDVWYSFVADSTGFNFTITHDDTLGDGLGNDTSLTATSVDLILFSPIGSSGYTYCDTTLPCGAPNACEDPDYDLVGLACWEDDGTQQLDGSTVGMLVPGQTYYFLVSSAVVSGETPGSFEVCFSTTPQLPPADACDEAQTLCDDTPFHETASGFVPQENITTNTCFGSTKNAVKWYQWTAATSGTMGFVIDPGAEDYDWILWNTSVDPCAAVMPFPTACNWSGCTGATGIDLQSNDCSGPPSNYDAFGDRCTPSAQCPSSPTLGAGLLTVNAGDTYTLLIDNWTGGSGFDFQFSDSMTTLIGPQAPFTLNSYVCAGGSLYVDLTADIQTPGFDYVWDFGDGNYGSGFSTTHTYASDSTFVIRLNVADTNSTTTCLQVQEIVVSCPLPVIFTQFYGDQVKGVNELTWATPVDLPTARFTVKRSFDLNNWYSLGDVMQSSGKNSDAERKYTYNDGNIPDMVNAAYYKIAHYDLMGVQTTSEIIKIIPGEDKPKSLLKVYDMMGREVAQPTPGAVYIYLYDDGSTEKKIILR